MLATVKLTLNAAIGMMKVAPVAIGARRVPFPVTLSGFFTRIGQRSSGFSRVSAFGEATRPLLEISSSLSVG